MPRAGDPVAVDEGEPALADDLEVVARDRLAPPGLLDAPAIHDLDRLAPAGPVDRHAPILELDRDLRVTSEETGQGVATSRHAQRRSGSGASGSRISARRIRSSP